MEQICGNCEHFRIHYIKMSGSFYELKTGHCRFPRYKTRKAKTKACENFIEKRKKEEDKIYQIRISFEEL